MNIKLFKLASEFTLVLIALMATISSVKVVSLNSEPLEISNARVENQLDRQYYQQLKFARTLQNNENIKLGHIISLSQQLTPSLSSAKILNNLTQQSEPSIDKTKTFYSTILLVREKPRTITEPSFVLGLFALVFSTSLWLKTKKEIGLQLELRTVRDRDTKREIR